MNYREMGIFSLFLIHEYRMKQSPDTKVIVFDYDGVIVDTFPNVFETYQVMCRELNATTIPRTIEEFRLLYGHDTYRELYARLGIPAECIDQGNVIFKREMLRQERCVFEGIPAVLETLAETHILALVSMSPEELVAETLERFDLARYFRLVVAQSERVPHPKSEGLEMAKQAFGVTGTEMLAIGDRNVDHDVATRAGIEQILLVDYGWGYDHDRYPQSFPVLGPMDLLVAVRRMEASRKTVEASEEL